ncbi:4-hydroxythreonine-4-phosphate dehydrogenase PdxA [Roseisolibacter sp. H3M3-2]|uniref:4-hydroxythreonine-4-phosphate dehydrogenase PdxA n=1 Tax=Roseisolibacter sp. H3M3-2 TaxID=3031323 RepID=UPI0023DC22F4|nr:4-hydroxythreonine-4-phosphate dehydrogenase PdxA [Roseisolibacter sp. H3M3-2]MDF1503429.1 4-hydroxythreonine-4-phosphate dehydrogenase PdxA [Roseisolibacter sp. H3M3-2]
MAVTLAVTVGDPRGIGPELVAKTLGADVVPDDVSLVVVGPSGAGIGVDVDVGTWAPGAGAAEAGRLAGRAIEEAVRLAQRGAVQGIVTAPLDKAALHAGGYDFPGHTEMLGALTGREPAMMLAATRPSVPGGSPLRVVLATTHVALRDVPQLLTAEAIGRAAGLTRDHLRRWFGIDEPRIALCALNPHAGDGGRFGREDDELLAPAARAFGLAGPLPADTVFVRAMRGAFDAVVAPYHDVGMTAIKVAAFGHAVNVTLGLPFPRTSPDHGTALDIAGHGIADPSSFHEALRLCVDLAAREVAVP